MLRGIHYCSGVPGGPAGQLLRCLTDLPCSVESCRPVDAGDTITSADTVRMSLLCWHWLDIDVALVSALIATLSESQEIGTRRRPRQLALGFAVRWCRPVFSTFWLSALRSGSSSQICEALYVLVRSEDSPGAKPEYQPLSELH